MTWSTGGGQFGLGSDPGAARVEGGVPGTLDPRPGSMLAASSAGTGEPRGALNGGVRATRNELASYDEIEEHQHVPNVVNCPE